MLAEHEKWMKAALSLARRGLGTVAPNPAVGCLLVKDSMVVGRGWTQPGGRPHAETQALEMAGPAAFGAIAYVTLEPCAHHGETAPCAEALIKTGVAEVIVAVIDPDTRVAGKGIAALEQAGINTVVGVSEAEAAALNIGFFRKNTDERPSFTLKTAATIDGRIATRSGDSKWVTGPEARQYGHMVRAQNDAILVGVNTVLADDPSLDCRIAGLGHRSPIPVVLDSKLRTPTTSKLIKNAAQRAPIIICNKTDANKQQAAILTKLGAIIITVHNTRDIADVAKALVNKGLTRVLVEGGSKVSAAFLKAGYCDKLLSFTAGKIIGADGLGSVGNMALAQLGDAPHLKLESVRKIGPDLLATYVNAE